MSTPITTPEAFGQEVAFSFMLRMLFNIDANRMDDAAVALDAWEADLMQQIDRGNLGGWGPQAVTVRDAAKETVRGVFATVTPHGSGQ
jgi:hypothetical protein